MKLTREEFTRLEHLMPIPRKEPEVSNNDFLCALLYIIKNGRKFLTLKINTLMDI